MIPNVLAETRVQALPGFGLPPAFSRRIVMFLTAIIFFNLTRFASTRQSKGCTDEVSQQSVRT